MLKQTLYYSSTYSISQTRVEHFIRANAAIRMSIRRIARLCRLVATSVLGFASIWQLICIENRSNLNEIYNSKLTLTRLRYLETVHQTWIAVFSAHILYLVFKTWTHLTFEWILKLFYRSYSRLAGLLPQWYISTFGILSNSPIRSIYLLYYLKPRFLLKFFALDDSSDKKMISRNARSKLIDYYFVDFNSNQNLVPTTGLSNDLNWVTYNSLVGQYSSSKFQTL